MWEYWRFLIVITMLRCFWLKSDLSQFFGKNHHFRRNFYGRRIFHRTPKIFSQSKIVSPLDKYFDSRQFQWKFWKYQRILVPVWRMQNEQKKDTFKMAKIRRFWKKIEIQNRFLVAQMIRRLQKNFSESKNDRSSKLFFIVYRFDQKFWKHR